MVRCCVPGGLLVGPVVSPPPHAARASAASALKTTWRVPSGEYIRTGWKERRREALLRTKTLAAGVWQRGHTRETRGTSLEGACIFTDMPRARSVFRDFGTNSEFIAHRRPVEIR